MKEKGERLQETGGQIGLKINIQKTKEIRIGVRQQESLRLHGEAVERVSEFTYLESIISETGGTDEDKIVRIRKSREENVNGSGIRYGRLRIISPVTLPSGAPRGLEEEVAQSNPGGEM